MLKTSTPAKFKQLLNILLLFICSIFLLNSIITQFYTMKTKFFIFWICTTALVAHAQTPKLYVSIVSHNEDNIGYNTSSSYLNGRNALKTFGTAVKAKNAKWNFGSDYKMLKAALKWDTGSVITSTSGKNIVKYLKEDQGIDVDPHSHESKYNYGTIAWLITQLGVTPSKVMSGFLWNSAQNGHWWYDYQSSCVSDSIPSYTWYPESLWGAGSPSHVSDPEYWGLWKPKDVAGFTTHQSSNNLVFVGQGCKIKVDDTSQVMVAVNRIKDAIQKIQSGIAPSSGIYYTSIFFSEGDLPKTGVITKLSTIIDSLNIYVSQGKLEWKSITEVVNFWKTTYANQPFMKNCDFSPVDIHEFEVSNGLRYYPNPAINELTISNFDNKLHEYTLTDVLGNISTPEIIRETDQEIILNLTNYPNGLYIISSENFFGTTKSKLIIER